MQNFHYVDVLLDLLYGIEMDSEDIEEIGLIAWNLIGNKNIKLYKFCAELDCNNSVTLPCNIEEGGKVEAVTIGYEEGNAKPLNLDDINSFNTENLIEALKYNTSPFYISGKLVKYQQVGNKLFFNDNYGSVNILYKGVLMDEDGLPELTDKEANAIATYIAYVVKYKEGLVTNNTGLILLANMLNAQWLKLCDQARVTYLNLNDTNEILEIRNSFDRSWYKKSYKPIK